VNIDPAFESPKKIYEAGKYFSGKKAESKEVKIGHEED